MYHYKCKLDRVIDGDTVDATIELGFKITIHKRIRLMGLDAPETRTRDKEEKEHGLESKAWLANRIKVDGDGYFELITEKDDSGKYGRLLGTLYVDHVNLNEQMVDLQLAEPYNGGKR